MSTKTSSLPHPTTTAEPLGRRFWLEWTLASGVGWAIGALAALYLSDALYPLGNPLLLAVAPGLLLGTLLGLPQWLVLRRWLPQPDRWVLATMGGWMIAWVVLFFGLAAFQSNQSATPADPLGRILTYAIDYIALGAVIGLILGMLQRLALSRHIASPGWWVFASAIAWGVGLVQVYAVGIAAATLFDSPTADGVFQAAQLAVGLVAGALTGVALIRLLRQPPPPPDYDPRLR